MFKYGMRLTQEEWTALTDGIGEGKVALRKIKHANVLSSSLRMDPVGAMRKPLPPSTSEPARSAASDIALSRPAWGRGCNARSATPAA